MTTGPIVPREMVEGNASRNLADRGVHRHEPISPTPIVADQMCVGGGIGLHENASPVWVVPEAPEGIVRTPVVAPDLDEADSRKGEQQRIHEEVGGVVKGGPAEPGRGEGAPNPAIPPDHGSSDPADRAHRSGPSAESLAGPVPFRAIGGCPVALHDRARRGGPVRIVAPQGSARVEEIGLRIALRLTNGSGRQVTIRGDPDPRRHRRQVHRASQGCGSVGVDSAELLHFVDGGLRAVARSAVSPDTLPPAGELLRR